MAKAAVGLAPSERPQRDRLEAGGLGRLPSEVVDSALASGAGFSPRRPPPVQSNRFVLTHSRSPPLPGSQRLLSFGSGALQTPGTIAFLIWKTCNSHILDLD